MAHVGRGLSYGTEKSPAAKSFSLVTNLALGLVVLTLLGGATLHLVLRGQGYTFYRVATGSMAPAIEPGDVIATKSVAPHLVQRGDVIAFRQPGISVPVVHRVVGIESAPDLRSVFQDRDGSVLSEKMTWSPRTFHTKGDANPTVDATPVEQSRLVGRYEFIVPGVLGFVATQLGGPAMLVVGFGVLGAATVASVADALSKRRSPSGNSKVPA